VPILFRSLLKAVKELKSAQLIWVGWSIFSKCVFIYSNTLVKRRIWPHFCWVFIYSTPFAEFFSYTRLWWRQALDGARCRVHLFFNIMTGIFKIYGYSKKVPHYLHPSILTKRSWKIMNISDLEYVSFPTVHFMIPYYRWGNYQKKTQVNHSCITYIHINDSQKILRNNKKQEYNGKLRTVWWSLLRTREKPQTSSYSEGY
jgi:hypothetical protein